MDVTIVTTARTNEDALELLKMMGMPFAENNLLENEIWLKKHGWSAISAKLRR